MRVDRITASLRYSEDSGRGAWRSLELSAEAEIQPGESWKIAQTNLYGELAEQFKALWKTPHPPEMPQEAAESSVQASASRSSSEGSRQVPARQNASSGQPVDHFCQEHGVPFRERDGRFGKFWSHQIEGTRVWCNESKR